MFYPNNINNLDELFLCNHEEADTCIFLHAKNASDNGIRKLSIVTVDTDVVIVALYHFFVKSWWAVDRNWSWSKSQISSNPYICSCFEGRKLSSSAVLVCCYGLWHCLNVCWERKENCLENLESISECYASLCKVTLFICTFHCMILICIL